MPRGGARPGAGRKPGSSPKADSKAVIKREETRRRQEARAAPVLEGMLDSLTVMRRGLQIMVNEVAPALKKVHDIAAENKDTKEQLAVVRELKSTILDSHTIAKDLAPYEHRRLAGEKPLDQDKREGPPIVPMTAADIAQ